MKVLGLFQYVYLVFAALFTYNAITTWNENRGRAYFSLLFVALSIFMFFFRKKFRKKFEDRNNQ